jgi:hypothetical protein
MVDDDDVVVDDDDVDVVVVGALMSTHLSDKQLLELARHGARARIEPIRQEIAALETVLTGGGASTRSV